MADSSTQRSHPRRSEPISKPAGLHLKKRLRLPHVWGPAQIMLFFVIVLLVLVSRHAGSESIQLERHSGTYMVPVRINKAITLPFILDSGSADVAIPADVFSTLFRTGTVMTSDFIGTGVYRLADGSETPSERFVLHELSVGHYTVTNVIANVVPVKGDPLLGQSFLSKLPKWAIDNMRHVLILGGESRSAEGQEATTRTAPTPLNTMPAIRDWPPVGAWVVLLSPLLNGGGVCMAITRGPPYGPDGYRISFAIGQRTTHLYLGYHGPMIPTPQAITLSVDGNQIAKLPVLEHTTVEAGKSYSIMADVPADMLSKTLFPAMINRTTLTVTVGQYAYPMSIIDYRRVMGEIFACADAFQATHR